jgi:hypothetical protein
LNDEQTRQQGLQIFKAGFVRRLSPNHFVARSLGVEAWQLVELKNGKWECDCEAGKSFCPHLYAAELNRSTSKLQPDVIDESHLKCRYCSSLDVSGCGFRYGARGISKRFVCHDCLRKFSIPYTNLTTDSKTQELAWLLNQVGQLTSKLTELLHEINSRLETLIATR